MLSSVCSVVHTEQHTFVRDGLFEDADSANDVAHRAFRPRLGCCTGAIGNTASMVNANGTDNAAMRQ